MRHILALLILLACTAGSLASSPIRPDPRLTPGVGLPGITVTQIRQSGWAKRHRDVPEKEKRRVYTEYGIAHHAPRAFEVDHLIPLELGGSNDIRNLWPESYTGPWNAHIKDKLEDRLHALVCAGRLSLTVAQHAIATDWIRAFGVYCGGER